MMVPSKLVKGIEEIDALMATSERARKAVSERRARLVAEQREVECALSDLGQIESKEADHALLFHLGDLAQVESTVPSLPSHRKKNKSEICFEPPADAIIPHPPEYATKTEANEWDSYYRYCARGALFSALERARDQEKNCMHRAAEASERLAAALEADEEHCVYDEAVRELEEDRRQAISQLDKVRRDQALELKARFAAYEPRPPLGPGHEHRLKELNIMLPSMTEILQSSTLQKTKNSIDETNRNQQETQFDHSTSDDVSMNNKKKQVILPSTTKPRPMTLQPKKKQKSTRKKKARKQKNNQDHMLPLHELPGDTEAEAVLNECILESAAVIPSPVKKTKKTTNDNKALAPSIPVQTKLTKAFKVSAEDRLQTILTKGSKTNVLAKCLPATAFKALQSKDFRQVVDVCADVLVFAGFPRSSIAKLTTDDHSPLLANALAEVARAPAVRPTLGPHRPVPTSLECSIYAKAILLSIGAISFIDLARGVMACAALDEVMSLEAIEDALFEAREAEIALSTDLDPTWVEATASKALRSFFSGYEIHEFKSKPHELWRIVKESADAYNLSSGKKQLQVVPQADAELGVVPCLIAYGCKNGDALIKADDTPRFVRFALVRTELAQRRCDRDAAAAVETAYRNLLVNPPATRRSLLAAIEPLEVQVGNLSSAIHSIQLLASDAFHAALFHAATTQLITLDTKHEIDWALIVPPLLHAAARECGHEVIISSAQCRLYSALFARGGSLTAVSPAALCAIASYTLLLVALEPLRPCRNRCLLLPSDDDYTDDYDHATAEDKEHYDQEHPDSHSQKSTEVNEEADLALRRAFRSAVIHAAGKAQDYEEAMQALGGTDSLEPVEAAALLRPFAASEAVLNFDTDAAARRLAINLASGSSRGTTIDAHALRRFVEDTRVDQTTDLSYKHTDEKKIILARTIKIVSTEHFAFLVCLQGPAAKKDYIKFTLEATVLPGGHHSSLDFNLPIHSPLEAALLPSLIANTATFVHFRLDHPKAIDHGSSGTKAPSVHDEEDQTDYSFDNDEDLMNMNL